MEELDKTLPNGNGSKPLPDPTSEQELSAQKEYENAVLSTTDLSTWEDGIDLMKMYSRLEREVSEAAEDEEKIIKQVRQEIFPKIEKGARAISCSGLHSFDPDIIAKAHRGLLFNGGVEACDGTNVVHDTIPITITQIGICLASYQGQGSSYVHRLFRRDLKVRGEDPVKEAIEMLENRSKRGSVGMEEGDSQLSNSSLARRGIMAYAERAILLKKSSAKWRMGHGNPVPYELMTGFWAGRREMTEAAIDVMSELILEHKRFIYVPSAPSQRHLLTLGNALKPLEYLILTDQEDELVNLVKSGNARDEQKLPAGAKGKRTLMLDFAHEVGSKLALGLYRASRFSPPYLFYAHKDYAQTAALIAMADSVLQEHRGFPFLIDIADRLCQSTFGAGDFTSSVQQAYAQTGQPYRYLSERETR